jgi:hypothetical protein
MLGHFIAFIDRVNVGFAALQMNHAMGLNASAFRLGGGLFYLTYALFEIPSNLAMQKVGAQLWIARIMIRASQLARAEPAPIRVHGRDASRIAICPAVNFSQSKTSKPRTYCLR